MGGCLGNIRPTHTKTPLGETFSDVSTLLRRRRGTNPGTDSQDRKGRKLLQVLDPNTTQEKVNNGVSTTSPYSWSADQEICLPIGAISGDFQLGSAPDSRWTEN